MQTALCSPRRLTGPQCPPGSPRHVFHSLAQKSAYTVMRHKLFDNNMTQLIRTRPQNVCLWGPAHLAMCLRRGKRLKKTRAGCLGVAGGEGRAGPLYVHKRCTGTAHLGTKYFSLKQNVGFGILHLRLEFFSIPSPHPTPNSVFRFLCLPSPHPGGGKLMPESFYSSKVVQFRNRTDLSLSPHPPPLFKPHF